MTGCKDCNSNSIDYEIMFAVTGEEGNMPEQRVVATCLDCGCKYDKVIVSSGDGSKA